MKQIIISVLIIVLTISLIVTAFTVNQVENENQRLKTDLTYRTTLLAESLRESIEPNFINKSDTYLEGVLERFTTKERLAGLGVYDNKGNMIVASSTASEATLSAQQVISNTMDA
ncbi:hypothetical protein HYS95_01860, partial [Candidatus Daviesbacteria bacterium]|nr:hypothetical protein [Candidatus Daviesbacteria bacterium]